MKRWECNRRPLTAKAPLHWLMEGKRAFALIRRDTYGQPYEVRRVDASDRIESSGPTFPSLREAKQWAEREAVES